MYLAWKELKKNKGKYSLITSILVMLIFMVLFLTGLANGLSRATSALIEDADAMYYIVSEDSDGLITRSNITIEQWEQIKAQYGDQVTAINLSRMTMQKQKEENKLDITYLAINPQGFMMPAVVEGERPLNDNEIVLDTSYRAEGIRIGDIIIEPSSGLKLKVTGFVKEQSYAHSSIGIINPETYVAIRTNINSNYTTSYHGIAVCENDGMELDMEGLMKLSKSEIISNIPGHAQEQMTINMILWVLVVVSAAILGVFFYVITIQKTSQFGVLKALGMQMKSLGAMVISQVIFLSGFSMLIGNLLTFIMSCVLPETMPFSLNPQKAVIISLTYVGISILCSLLSLIKIAKVDPIITIGGNE